VGKYERALGLHGLELQGVNYSPASNFSQAMPGHGRLAFHIYFRFLEYLTLHLQLYL